MAEFPSSERVERALRVLRHSMHPNHRKLLLTHYRAPGHSITGSELAKAVGYANHSAVNLQYGRFGEHLATQMAWQVPPDEPKASAFATFSEGTPGDPHTRWVLRPQVAEALERLGWVRPGL